MFFMMHSMVDTSCSSHRAAADVSETRRRSTWHLPEWTRDAGQSEHRTASWHHHWPAGLDGGRHAKPRLALVALQPEPRRRSGVRGRDALRVTPAERPEDTAAQWTFGTFSLLFDGKSWYSSYRINNWQTIWMSSTAGLKKHPRPALDTSPHNH